MKMNKYEARAKEEAQGMSNESLFSYVVNFWLKADGFFEHDFYFDIYKVYVCELQERLTEVNFLNDVIKIV